MRKETAELLVGNEEAGIGRVMEGYSGRGMMGRKTTAVTFESHRELRAALLNAAFTLGADVMSGDDEELAENVMEELKDLGQDSLGRGLVVY